MSQQKVFFAVCVAAGLVAMVSSQGMNINKCSSEGQKLITQFTKDLQGAFSETSEAITSSTGQSLNLNGINKDINDIASAYINLIDINDGISIQKLLSGGQNILQKQMSLVMKYANIDMGMGTMMELTSLNTKIVALNGRLVAALVRVCTPRAY